MGKLTVIKCRDAEGKSTTHKIDTTLQIYADPSHPILQCLTKCCGKITARVITKDASYTVANSKRWKQLIHKSGWPICTQWIKSKKTDSVEVEIIDYDEDKTTFGQRSFGKMSCPDSEAIYKGCTYRSGYMWDQHPVKGKKRKKHHRVSARQVRSCKIYFSYDMSECIAKKHTIKAHVKPFISTQAQGKALGRYSIPMHTLQGLVVPKRKYNHVTPMMMID